MTAAGTPCAFSAGSEKRCWSAMGLAKSVWPITRCSSIIGGPARSDPCGRSRCACGVTCVCIGGGSCRASTPICSFACGGSSIRGARLSCACRSSHDGRRRTDPFLPFLPRAADRLCSRDPDVGQNQASLRDRAGGFSVLGRGNRGTALETAGRSLARRAPRPGPVRFVRQSAAECRALACFVRRPSGALSRAKKLSDWLRSRT